ncbi:hypothetical protein D7Z54_09010 [Salibacterium salarium]|uniref:Heptaprenyl diphosphate synthase n=1 Tax=Salibacterium salarium TaxID=284579 RepID=A0A428N6D3_9BACI|nr:heptaprenyl diphosphate synthase component 1 [Salibacterium salarium]RSL33819.1 hypothetical protein D7Z54_09010 [Salibacterium salarium]
MVNLQQSLHEVHIIENEFRKVTTHPYLLQYIDDVDVEEDIIYFLLEIMQYSTLSPSDKREQILSALLVQAAFKTHDRVQSHNENEPEQKKTRQLTVLAGDFFSSLYHAMLVKEVHSGIIPVFSNAIQIINEEKMRLHFNDIHTEKELMNRLYAVEGSFLSEIATYYGELELGSLAEVFFLLKKLIDEQKPANNKYLSAFTFAVHAYQEGEEKEIVREWPPSNTKRWMSETIYHLQQQLYDKLQTYSFIHNTPLYDRLQEWVSFDNKLEIK